MSICAQIACGRMLQAAKWSKQLHGKAIEQARTAHKWPLRGSRAAQVKDMLRISRLRASRQDAEAHAMTWISASGSMAAIWRTMSDGRLCQPAWALVDPRAHLVLLQSLLGGHEAKAICRWHTRNVSGFPPNEGCG